MSLPAGQQRVLNRIDDSLQASEPHLTAMYAIFTRLSAGEPVTREKMPAGPLRWLESGSVVYAVVLIPVMFAAIITGVLAGGGARNAVTCKTSYAAAVSKAAGTGIAPVTRYVTLAGVSREPFPPARDAAATAGTSPGVC
jgi:hypothetical protein